MNIEAEVRAYVAADLLSSVDTLDFNDTASFLREGVIDSLRVMDLVAFVSSRFGIPIDPHEIIPENFDSIAQLAAFIRRKQSPTRELIAA